MAATLRDQVRFSNGFVAAGSPYPSDTPLPLRLALAETNRDRGAEYFRDRPSRKIVFFEISLIF
jgi:hypothetical protein